MNFFKNLHATSDFGPWELVTEESLSVAVVAIGIGVLIEVVHAVVVVVVVQTSVSDLPDRVLAANLGSSCKGTCSRRR